MVPQRERLAIDCSVAVKWKINSEPHAYLAIAEQEGIQLWIGDQRLYNSLHAQYPFVRWVADYLRKRP
jgi:hypothetical protein